MNLDEPLNYPDYVPDMDDLAAERWELLDLDDAYDAGLPYPREYVSDVRQENTHD